MAGLGEALLVRVSSSPSKAEPEPLSGPNRFGRLRLGLSLSQAEAAWLILTWPGGAKVPICGRCDYGCRSHGRLGSRPLPPRKKNASNGTREKGPERNNDFARSEEKNGDSNARHYRGVCPRHRDGPVHAPFDS